MGSLLEKKEISEQTCDPQLGTMMAKSKAPFDVMFHTLSVARFVQIKAVLGRLHKSCSLLPNSVERSGQPQSGSI